jgi:hypothetical protein
LEARTTEHRSRVPENEAPGASRTLEASGCSRWRHRGAGAEVSRRESGEVGYLHAFGSRNETGDDGLAARLWPKPPDLVRVCTRVRHSPEERRRREGGDIPGARVSASAPGPCSRHDIRREALGRDRTDTSRVSGERSTYRAAEGNDEPAPEGSELGTSLQFSRTRTDRSGRGPRGEGAWRTRWSGRESNPTLGRGDGVTARLPPSGDRSELMD